MNPNEPELPPLDGVPVDALHAGAIRAIAEYVVNPRPEIAETVVRLLTALRQHPDRFAPPCGYDVYRRAHEIFDMLLAQTIVRTARPDPTYMH